MTVKNYKLIASNGRVIRTATMVIFPSGKVVKFIDKLSKREAIRQALEVK